MLTINNVKKNYGRRLVLDELNFHIDEQFCSSPVVDTTMKRRIRLRHLKNSCLSDGDIHWTRAYW